VVNFTDEKFKYNPLRVGAGYRVMRSHYNGNDNEFLVKGLNFINQRARYRDPAFTVSDVKLRRRCGKAGERYIVDSEGYLSVCLINE